MVTIRFKTKSGHLQELQIERLLEIDGVPHNAGENLRDEMIHLVGRVEAIEHVLAIEVAGELPDVEKAAARTV